ncbi:pyruvate kinase [Candidatus Peregrinibacteria bacterium]|nr:pyruvate kinase [Candidatus Peregrinibacteria bacterium]
MRLTKIVCTLGPASQSLEAIAALAEGGMNVARINLSHGGREQHKDFIAKVRRVSADRKKRGLPAVGIMLDTKGAEIRTGDTDHPFEIKKGQEVVFSPDTGPHGKRTTIAVNYSGFGKDVRETDRILIDNGELIFDILSIEKNGDVIAKARQSGTIGSRRHINLPGADIDLPSLTEQDWKDLEFGVEEHADFVALSFIRTGDDIADVRTLLRKKKSGMQIVAKIETKQAVDHIEEIIRASDGVMVARGDLGAELPFETLPVIQDQIVLRCRQAGVPVIVATHMLESMIHQPTPTRAEVTDIAHAATTGADATMLSGETASGKHPLLALDAMDRVLRATESHLSRFVQDDSSGVRTEREARAEAATTLADSTEAHALLAFTRTGQTARDLAKFRPRIPIITFTDHPEVARMLQIAFGVLPLEMPLDEDPETTVLNAMQICTRAGLLKSGDRVVIVSDTKAHEQLINTVQLRVIP